MRTIDAIKHLMRTGDARHIAPSVWKATQANLDVALRMERDCPSEMPPMVQNTTATYVGTLAGLAFAHRERWYDEPYPGREEHRS